MGLVLNASKCELIADSKLVVADPLLASFSRVEVEESSQDIGRGLVESMR